MQIVNRIKRAAAIGALVFSGAVVVSPVATASAQAPKHHSKIKGAIVGGVVGHMAGGHTKMGAVAGAMVQHHRNSKAKKIK